MSDNRPVVCLFGHSFIKRLCHWSRRRGELVVRTLGLQSCAEVIAYGQGGLSFKRVLESPDRYLKEIGHPDLLVIDQGSNDLACVYTTVAEGGVEMRGPYWPTSGRTTQTRKELQRQWRNTGTYCRNKAVATPPDVIPRVVSQHPESLRTQNDVIPIKWNENQVITNVSSYSWHRRD